MLEMVRLGQRREFADLSYQEARTLLASAACSGFFAVSVLEFPVPEFPYDQALRFTRYLVKGFLEGQNERLPTGVGK